MGRTSRREAVIVRMTRCDLEAARQVLDVAQGVDEAELTRLADESGPPPPD
jgi:hypothetical protein